MNDLQRATKRFAIAQREPWSLPEKTVEFPGPKVAPSQPAPINLLTTILPPVILMGGTVVISLISKQTNWTLIAPMMLMSLGFPLANIIGVSSQKKKYAQSLAERESSYKKVLSEEKLKIRKLIDNQRNILEREYPPINEVSRIAFNHTKRLWWRRSTDEDFLAIRLGRGQGKLSFIISPPKNAVADDPLFAESLKIIDEFQTADDIPLLLELGKIGSIAISSKAQSSALDLTRRIIIDLAVHHSPQDIEISILSNSKKAEDRWGWLKWLPQTSAFSDINPPRLNFTDEESEGYLHWLLEETNSRLKQDESANQKRKSPRKAIVVFLDEGCLVRQTPDIARIADCGVDIGIYLIFVGGKNWPRECRARIDISDENDFLLTETWNVSAKDIRVSGKFEVVSLEQAEKIARALASIEVVGSQNIVQLPESIRLSQVLGNNSLTFESIKQHWTRNLSPRELLKFPVGVRSGHEGLEPMYLDLKPEDLGGQQAFHTVLIGTTGSGKSVFLQSMILSAAYDYSPTQLNFLLMDFKAGASELSKLKELPHVVGMVTDLSPELASRSLIALDSEIQRRKRIFDEAGKISDIWSYNQRFSGSPLPHLVLVLDEFAKGVEILPDLQRVLQTLATQGRALGVYLLLANQKVTAAVDNLLANIGWRIVLRVGEKEEMRLVDPSLPRTTRPGRGYIRVKEQIAEFQGSRSDQIVQKDTTQALQEFTIYDLLPNGKTQKLYVHADNSIQAEETSQSKLSELDTLIGLMKECEEELQIKPAHRIYLDPLPGIIGLQELLSTSEIESCFSGGKWNNHLRDENTLIIPVGYLDKPDECIQEPLNIDFNDKDGHLWIVGAPGSGKSTALTSLLLSLALTHSPEEAQIYVLDFGSGTLKLLEELPHVGSVIRLQEKEKIQRLLKYLDQELDRRTSHETLSGENSLANSPAIFVVINNFAEMRTNYPDEADHISRYIRDGKAARIHLIITTNRGPELSRMVSSNISRRLVLQLASRDEYVDVVGKVVPPLSIQAEGRGFWVDGNFFECQIARASHDIKPLIKAMNNAWKGKRPLIIGTIPNCLPLSALMEQSKHYRSKNTLRVPVGISYESLNIVSPDLIKELPAWLILGPRESGKSNFLGCIVRSVLELNEQQWRVFGFSLRRSTLADLAKALNKFNYSNTIKSAAAKLKEIAVEINEHEECEDCRYLLLVDDLGAFFENGAEEANIALNSLIPLISSRRDVYFMAAGLLDELRLQLASNAIKLLRQGHTGVVLSKDTSELDWLGASIPLDYRKLDFPVGRGFFISKGRPILLQTPSLGDCEKRKENNQGD